MMNKRLVSAIVAILIFITMVLAIGISVSTETPIYAQVNPIVKVDFSGQGVISPDIQQAIINTLQNESNLFTERTYFVLSAYREYENSWAEAVVVAPESEDWTTLQGLPSTELLLTNISGEWEGHSALTSGYELLLQQVPSNFIEHLSISRQTAISHKFPWKGGETWSLQQGWHGAGFYVQNNIDFAPVGASSNDVLASASGILHIACISLDDPYQIAFYIDHTDGTRTEYLHIAKSSARLDLAGQNISQGQYLGDIFQAYNFNYACGHGSGPHLHFGLSDRYVSIDGYNANDVGNSAYGTQFTSSNGGSSGSQVKLYSTSNYGGSVVWSGGTGFSNGPNANSYSMEIPGGWSVKTWSGDNRSGDYRCWSSSVNNLQDHGWQLKIQSIEAYNYNACPATPTPMNTSTPTRTPMATPTRTPTPHPTPTRTPTASSQSPHLVVSSLIIDDNNTGQSSGNNNHVVDCGETIELYVYLLNSGSTTARSVNADISTNDNNITWLYNTSSNYPDINVTYSEKNNNDFDFAVSPLVSPAHNIPFNMEVTATNGGYWNTTFNVPVTCNPPEKPGALYKINTTASTITFGWPDNSNNEAGFRIYRWDGAAVDFVYYDQVDTNIHSYTDTGLPCNAQQWYKVTAFNGGGETEKTGWLEVRTAACSTTPSPTPTQTPAPSPTMVPINYSFSIFLPLIVK